MNLSYCKIIDFKNFVKTCIWTRLDLNYSVSKEGPRREKATDQAFRWLKTLLLATLCAILSFLSFEVHSIVCDNKL